MIVSLIQHARRVLAARRYEKKNAGKRSPEWPKVREAHLAKHDSCAACGGKDMLQVHHERPFHSYPRLELEESNLITLCEALHKDCHILVGHGDSFLWYNPNVVADAKDLLEHPDQRDAICARAKKARLRNEPGDSATPPPTPPPAPPPVPVA